MPGMTEEESLPIVSDERNAFVLSEHEILGAPKDLAELWGLRAGHRFFGVASE